MYEVISYLALICALIYGLYLIIKHLRTMKGQRTAPQEIEASKKVDLLRQRSNQSLCLNLMAMEAARQMAAVAGKRSAEDETD